jgi:type IV secretion system protein VirD4
MPTAASQSSNGSTTPSREQSIIWETNGGIYFGSQVAEPKKAERPLEGKEVEPMVRGAAVKTTWQMLSEETRYGGDRHVLTIGPNGSGKTRKLLMPNLFRLRDWSCVVIDPKGELAAHTAVFRASRKNHKVMVIDPFHAIEKNYPNLYARYPEILRSKGFNPLRSLDPASEHFVDDAKTLSMALIKTDNARDPYWPLAAQALVKGLLMTIRLMMKPEEVSLWMLRSLLGLPAKEIAKGLDTNVKAFSRSHPAIAASLGQFTTYTPEDRELNGVLRTAIVQTDWLDSPLMQADLQGQVFDFAELKEVPTTIYLVLPPEYLASHGTWLRLMVTAILMPLLRSVEEPKVPVLFMLDEFAQLGHMEVIQNTYALMRGFYVKLWTIWQDLTQAKRLYREQWESFISNAGIIQTFAPQDLTTRDYLSRLADERTQWHQRENKSSNLDFKGHISMGSSQHETHIQERVLKPYELAALDQDEAVLFSRGGKVRLSVLPQPDLLDCPTPSDDVSVAVRLHQARRDIEEPCELNRDEQKAEPLGEKAPAV